MDEEKVSLHQVSTADENDGMPATATRAIIIEKNFKGFDPNNKQIEKRT